ncbi:hypothetical protein KFE94_07710 [bacterium SCSIO 12643]|nr:hypothetical protein KFE94_07710 [bacterium SCSIO 12643]
MIVSKKDPLNFYLALFFVSLFLGGMGVFLLNLFFSTPKQNDFHIFFLIFGILVLLVIIYTIWVYIRNTPKINIAKDRIQFNSETYLSKDIENIILNDIVLFPYIISHPVNGTSIYFKDGSVKQIFTDMYSNSWEIKSFLEQTIIKNQTYIPIDLSSIPTSSISLQAKSVFKGSPIFSLRGISLWSILLMMTYLFWVRIDTFEIHTVFFLSFFCLFWLLLHAWMMHYFVLTSEYLIIQNHILFWRNKTYPLKHINEIIYESKGKRPNGMRIITIDYKEALYPAGTLKDKTWMKLKSQLEQHQIKVRNECIFFTE